MARSEDRLAGWKQLAENGDPDAQIVMAWEYAKGKLVPKDFDRAVALFRAAEPARGRLARLALARAMIINRDHSFNEVIRQDCEAGFGPALYLMGVVALQGYFSERNVDQAVQYFSLAALDNHLPSKFYAWRNQRKSILEWLVTSPRFAGVALKVVFLSMRDPKDPRILGAV